MRITDQEPLEKESDKGLLNPMEFLNQVFLNKYRTEVIQSKKKPEDINVTVLKAWAFYKCRVRITGGGS